MSRPPRADRPTRMQISLPESIHARLMMILFSPAEQCVPKGAISAFIETLVRQALDRIPTTPKEPSDGPHA